MNPLLTILAVLVYLLVPAGVVVLCRRSRLAAKAGAILILYFLGIIVSNLLVFPFDGASEKLYPLQEALTSVTIPLALPMILFACDFRNWPVRRALSALLIGLVSIVCIVFAGYFLFGGTWSALEWVTRMPRQVQPCSSSTLRQRRPASLSEPLSMR